MAVVGEFQFAHKQHILCTDAQYVAREEERCYRQLRKLTPKVNKCILQYNKGRVSNSELKKVLEHFPDALEDCTRLTRRVAEFIPDDDIFDMDDITVPPSPVQAANPSHFPTPPGHSSPVNCHDLGIQLRLDEARRRVQQNLQGADNAGLPQPHGGDAVAAGPPGPGGFGQPPPADNGQGGQHQHNGCCPYCLHNMILACGEFISNLFGLFLAFFRALWQVICRVGRKLRDLALWLLQMIVEGWHRFGVWVVNRSEEIEEWIEEIRAQI